MENQESEKTHVQVASELNDRLGGGVLLGIECRNVFDTETNTSVRRILFSFSDESVTKFGDETIEVPVRSVKDVFIELKIGMDMRDVCIGLSRLTGHIASSILPLTSA